MDLEPNTIMLQKAVASCATDQAKNQFLANAEKAKVISARAQDITECLATLNLPQGHGAGRIAYHSACSMQHGQQIKSQATTPL